MSIISILMFSSWNILLKFSWQITFLNLSCSGFKTWNKYIHRLCGSIAIQIYHCNNTKKEISTNHKGNITVRLHTAKFKFTGETYYWPSQYLAQLTCYRFYTQKLATFFRLLQNFFLFFWDDIYLWSFLYFVMWGSNQNQKFPVYCTMLYWNLKFCYS